MTQSKSGSNEKFLFNVHVFDEVIEEEPEEEIPPPPMFSEQELEFARKKAFEDGRAKGSEEEKAKRSALLTGILQKISNDLGALFTEEEKRAKHYEQETVALTLEIFKKLFPLYEKNKGFEELAEHIRSVLQKQSAHRKIVISVSPDIKDDLEKLLKPVSDQMQSSQLSICSTDTLDTHDFSIAWDNGGAERSPGNIAKEIENLLSQTLADQDLKRDDRPDSMNDRIVSADTIETRPESGRNTGPGNMPEEPLDE